MTRALLLDTSFAARPIHDWLLEEGFEVWTIGNRPQDVLARRDARHYLQDNYADAVVVQSHVDRLDIDCVVPGCTDVSIETALRLRLKKTVLDTPDTYQKIADKSAFRALCAELDLPSPRRVFMEDLPVQGKLIAKPSDAFSGRGISVFDGADRAAGLRALTTARAESRNGEALLETYIDGQLHSYSAFLEDRKVAEAAIVREDGSVTPFAVDTSYVVNDFPADGIAAVKSAVERLAQALHLVDGLLHVQFIWDGKKPWLIELSRRCPGDLYPWLVELSTGQRHAARYASYFVGRQVRRGEPVVRRHILRHTLTAGHANYEALWFREATPVLEFHPLATSGREAPPNGRIDRVGLLFLEYQTESALREGHGRFLGRTSYRTAV